MILAISATGFVSLFFFDLFQTYRKKYLSSFFSIIGYSTLISTVVLLLFSYKITDLKVTGFSLFVLIAKIAGAGLFFFLLVYSNLIEIRIKSPYSEKPERYALTSGTYGMIRHPGFLWFLSFFLILISIYKNTEFTLISLSMIVMNFILILIEDIMLFPKIFHNYQEYKKTVPFLIPGLRIFTR